MKIFNHGVHVILDIVTCGLWLPVHLLLWAMAPTVPIGYGTSSAAAAAGSANTTIVFGAAGQHPQVFQSGQPPMMHNPYPQQVAPATQAHPPLWAIEEARERLPLDAPWDAVASAAWEFVQRKEQGRGFGNPERRELPE